MDLNIFKVRPSNLAALRQRLEDKGFELICTESEGDWRSEFLFLDGEEEVASWVQLYAGLFVGRELPTRKGQSAVHVFQRDDSCYAITYGSGHSYIRSLCDYDFGIDLAKRIADESDIKETAAKLYYSSRKKEHRTYRTNTRLDVNSGEAIAMIHATVIASKRSAFGRSGRFGVSAILSPPVGVDGIADLLSIIDAELNNPELFALPHDEEITDKAEIKNLDRLLVEEITAKGERSEFTADSLDLCGVDFVFGNYGRFSLKHPRRRKPLDFDLVDGRGHDLTIDDLRLYIDSNGLSGDEILKIEVTKYNNSGDPPWTSLTLKESLDYIVDSQRVALFEGKWTRFNQHYLTFLDQFVRDIETEEVEDDFKVISETEAKFNASDRVRRAGYKNYDQDFGVAVVESRTPVEAWDLRRGSTVYALKFGTAQKLGYVCDQAEGLLELRSNNATIKEVPKFDRYCLWLGYMAKKLPNNIADTNSIILKRKIMKWALLCRDARVTPVIKLSRHTGRQLVLV
ncbi:DUF6119 family protein [Nocardia sp. BMG51109]|uniref:DUF6119 family protein n=1 Tax=Nocardia sp. BMG51109 TaxID=1056816 RepID=UPI0018DBB37E|nr:DUF6119 family protein [Nocardia sp. BMG51109]